MTTLALDLGQHIGWVKGAAVGPLEHGSFPVEDTTDLGRWLRSIDAFLMNAMRGVDDIAVEQPFLQSGGKKADGTSKPGGYYPARKLLAQLGHVYYAAHNSGIAAKHVHEYPVATAKLTLAGSGKADKDQMVAAACDFYGWEPHEIDEHTADASAIFKVHLFGAVEGRRKKPRSSPGVSLLRGSAR